MSELRDWFANQQTEGIDYEDFKAARQAAIKASEAELNRGPTGPFSVANVATLATLLAYRQHQDEQARKP